MNEKIAESWLEGFIKCAEENSIDEIEDIIFLLKTAQLLAIADAYPDAFSEGVESGLQKYADIYDPSGGREMLSDILAGGFLTKPIGALASGLGSLAGGGSFWSGAGRGMADTPGLLTAWRKLKGTGIFGGTYGKEIARAEREAELARLAEAEQEKYLAAAQKAKPTQVKPTLTKTQDPWEMWMSRFTAPSVPSGYYAPGAAPWNISGAGK